MSVDSNPDAVYLDNAATTPLDPGVADAMGACLSRGGTFANPASMHSAGRASHALVERARRQVADLLRTAPRNLIFTSGATESDNLAIAGAASFRAHRGRLPFLWSPLLRISGPVKTPFSVPLVMRVPLRG